MPPLPGAAAAGVSSNQLQQGNAQAGHGTGGVVAGQVKAQDGDQQQWDSGEFTQLEKALRLHADVSPPSTHPEDMKTLFFTAWQYALLVEARNSWHGRPPQSDDDEHAQKPSGPREVSLDGISYRDSKHWTVWLNHERIEPDAIPPAVMDIKVSSDHVDLKWFDNSTNLIFPIRLRPHQRFNLDDRMFLPGAGT